MSHVDADSLLLDKIRKDEPDAFDRLVELYGDRIFAHGMRMCGHREDASDVFQDTLFQAFRSLKTLKEPKALRSWLYRVVSNACLMKRRKGKFEPRRELSLEVGHADRAVAAGHRLHPVVGEFLQIEHTLPDKCAGSFGHEPSPIGVSAGSDA